MMINEYIHFLTVDELHKQASTQMSTFRHEVSLTDMSDMGRTVVVKIRVLLPHGARSGVKFAQEPVTGPYGAVVIACYTTDLSGK